MQNVLNFNIVENYFNLNIEDIIDFNAISQNNNIYPIFNSGITCPSNKSKHFLLPMLLSKRFLENKNIYVYDNILYSFINNLNGTGRFFEGLSKENINIDKKILVISIGEDTQHFGQVFAMGLQIADYQHINDFDFKNILKIKNYDEIIFYTNELYDNHIILNNIEELSKNNNDTIISLTCILNYSKRKYENIFSLLTIDMSDNNKNFIDIYKCKFPFYENNKIKKALDNNATQDDNLIETIMTIMSTQDFNKSSNKIKIIFLVDDEFSYIPMLISEFMSGFDNYDIYFSKITKLDLNIKDKIIIQNKELSYIYNIHNEKYDFLFYITKKDIQYEDNIYKTLKNINNIQNINIIKEIY